LRLDPGFRFAIYAAFSLLFVTGAAWLVADQLKDDEAWQIAGAYLLMMHGGGAMVALMVLGALIPLHMRRGWRSRRNLLAGTAMLTWNAMLVLTSFALYYAGSEVLRPAASGIHSVLGLSLPLMFVHVVTGRVRGSRYGHSGAPRGEGAP
jgi:hypothetical protein